MSLAIYLSSSAPPLLGQTLMDWVSVATNLGIPAVCLLALGAGVWKVMTWLGQNIVKPVADRHVKFLDDLSTAIATQTQAQTSMGTQLSEIVATQSTISQQNERIADHLEKIVNNGIGKGT